MDVLDVKEICSTSEGSDSAGSDLSDEETAGPAMRQKNEVVQNTVSFDDEEKKRAGKRQKKKRKRTKRELRAQTVVKRERDRMALTLPDAARDRERERCLVRLATKGVVQLFNAVTERQKKLRNESLTKTRNKKRRMRGLSPESFNRKLSKIPVKDETENTKGDWLSEEKTKRQQLDTDGELDTSGIKTEPESDSE